MQINTAEIFGQLSPNKLELFRKTRLFDHFSGEFIVHKLPESEIHLVTDNNRTHLYFNIFEYTGEIILGYFIAQYYLPNHYNWAIVIGNYLASSCFYIMDFDYDVRYFKDHPYDTMISIKSEDKHNIIYGDYQYWLMQGEKPRHMVYYCDSNITIPDEIIYLHIECYCDIPCVINIPKQILFLEYKLKPINCDIVYLKDSVIEDFHSYNFCKRSKSARKI
jgi:hypothetical protein